MSDPLGDSDADRYIIEDACSDWISDEDYDEFERGTGEIICCT